ncbi:MAG: hybrid sensor histidine kinase/response regulator [Hyphomicrobiales bacterium]|nr:hybrid sensor histidine kinase/response regulator [Hyphomicrobiales bacterium]
MDELMRDFLTETAEHLEGIETQLIHFERNPQDPAPIASIFRLVHTIKGTASFLGLERLQKVAHAAETLIGSLRDGVSPTPKSVSLILKAMDRIKAITELVEASGGEIDGDDSDVIDAIDRICSEDGDEPAPAQSAANAAAHPHDAPPPARKESARAETGPETIRVAVNTIERIMEQVSELVLTRNQLLELTRMRDSDPVKAPLQRLSALTTDLQDAVMRARMQPVGRLFTSMPRLVRELSSELSKKINLVTEGADTELDRQLIEVIRDPLTHLIRNCADHGVETPEARRAAGKPEAGTIRVSATHEAGQISIEVSDDGRGLDADRIRAKAVKNGLCTEKEAAEMPEEQIYRFIFAPGFSTAALVTNVSGRGVGMDVVRTNLESIGGSIALSSTPGKGTRFSLKIPLTLAIAPALIVEIGDQRFALPQNAVVEAVAIGGEHRTQVRQVQNALVLRLRNEVIPVIDLRPVLALGASGKAEEEERLVVIMRVGAETFGVIVDSVSDVQEIVVKPLSASLAHLRTFSGHTILGDGSVVLILDPGGVAKNLGVEKSQEKASKSADGAVTLTGKIRMVQFRAGPGVSKVVPLSLVSRIITVEHSRIETSDGRLVMLYENRLLPVFMADPHQHLGEGASPVLIVTTDRSQFGLVAETILDILEITPTIQLAGESDAVVGAVEINGETVEFIDAAAYARHDDASALVREEAKTHPVLLASSDAASRDMFGPALGAAGYAVTLTRSVEETMERLHGGARFDAVVIEEEMAASEPGLADILRRLRADTPVIGLSSGAPQSEAPRLFSAIAGRCDRRALLRDLGAILAETKRDTKGMAA